MRVRLSPIAGFLSVILIAYSPFALSDVQVPADRHIGFSGIEYHIPRNTRMVLYKYKSKKNRSLAEASEIEADTRGVVQMSDSLRRVTAIDQDVVADCSIAIGNNTQPDIFSPKEQVVIIEGDVVNLGQCDQ